MADVIDIASQRRSNALFVLDVLLRAYVPKGTNDWREGTAALKALETENADSQAAALIADLLGALREVLPHLEGAKSIDARELGQDVRTLIAQAQRTGTAGVGEVVPEVKRDQTPMVSGEGQK
jgi:hypothetical protein